MIRSNFSPHVFDRNGFVSALKLHDCKTKEDAELISELVLMSDNELGHVVCLPLYSDVLGAFFRTRMSIEVSRLLNNSGIRVLDYWIIE